MARTKQAPAPRSAETGEKKSKAQETKEKMVAAAADLFRRQGYHATAFSEIVAESGAPRGAIYFHFPGGKEGPAARALEPMRTSVEALVSSLEPPPTAR